MIALLAYVPGLRDVFHTGPLGAWEWLLLLLWPPLVLGAEEARKAVVRRRAVAAAIDRTPTTARRAET